MSDKPILLDAFCGAGGAGMGYYRAGFEVVGVDIAPQKHYPFRFIQADALEYIAAHGKEYDAIHASPPCQAYSEITPMSHRPNHPDLIGPVRNLLLDTGKPFCIENVESARSRLNNPVLLCGSMFGMRIWRHRYFEIYPDRLILTVSCNHSSHPILVTGTPKRNGKRIKEPTTNDIRMRWSAIG